MTKFDPTIPATQNRVLSEPIRNNLNALNERTNQLTVSATEPVSTSISVGVADKVYFENNLYTPFTGAAFNLANSTTGVSNFIIAGTFKEVIVFYSRSSLGVGTLGFVEGEETVVRDHNTSTAEAIINDINQQRVSDGYGVSTPVVGVSPLDNNIILCSILVSNNGIVGQRGAINPIFDTDIIDLRPFMHRTVDTRGFTKPITAGSGTLDAYGTDSFAVPSNAPDWKISLTWTSIPHVDAYGGASTLYASSKVSTTVSVASTSGASDSGKTYDWMAIKPL